MKYNPPLLTNYREFKDEKYRDLPPNNAGVIILTATTALMIARK
ncbi:MAG: hypothetical protein WC749_09900 [Dehalococcoidia bacterium]